MCFFFSVTNFKSFRGHWILNKRYWILNKGKAAGDVQSEKPFSTIK
jgi:hypothetical protein